jgi:hypothetical protein
MSNLAKNPVTLISPLVEHQPAVQRSVVRIPSRQYDFSVLHFRYIYDEHYHFRQTRKLWRRRKLKRRRKIRRSGQVPVGVPSRGNQAVMILKKTMWRSSQMNHRKRSNTGL